ncbi:MAG: hypothetical protein MH825_12945 [Cyanobacteria bacterium]|nr:hypothetical protein [Cyanobacteriota bacterium]
MADPIFSVTCPPLRSRHRSRAWGRAIAAIALVGSLAGPAEASRPEEMSGTAPISQQADVPQQPETATPPTVRTASNWRTELIDIGQAPYQTLRLRPTPGDRQTMTARVSIKGTMVINGETTEAPAFPEIEMALSSLVEGIEPNGDIYYTLQYDRLGLVAGTGDANLPLEMIEAAFAPFKDLKFRILSSDRGQVKSIEMVSETALDPMARQMLDQLFQSLDTLSAPFPEEAIGTGARWRVVGTLEMAGMVLNQAVAFELQTLEEDYGILAMTLEQDGTMAAMGESRITSSGSGSLTLEWDRVLPSMAMLVMNATAVIDGGEILGPIEHHMETVMVAGSDDR